VDGILVMQDGSSTVYCDYHCTYIIVILECSGFVSLVVMHLSQSSQNRWISRYQTYQLKGECITLVRQSDIIQLSSGFVVGLRTVPPTKHTDFIATEDFSS